MRHFRSQLLMRCTKNSSQYLKQS